MTSLKIRLVGLFLMTLGGCLFVLAVKYVPKEWPQIFVGLLSVFSASMGFGLLIMPRENPPTAGRPSATGRPHENNRVEPQSMD